MLCASVALILLSDLLGAATRRFNQSALTKRLLCARHWATDKSTLFLVNRPVKVSVLCQGEWVYKELPVIQGAKPDMP